MNLRQSSIVMFQLVIPSIISHMQNRCKQREIMWSYLYLKYPMIIPKMIIHEQLDIHIWKLLSKKKKTLEQLLFIKKNTCQQVWVELHKFIYIRSSTLIFWTVVHSILINLSLGNTGEQGDECGGLTEFESGSSVNYSFSNFSFKVFLIVLCLTSPQLICKIYFYVSISTINKWE